MSPFIQSCQKQEDADQSTKAFRERLDSVLSDPKSPQAMLRELAASKLPFLFEMLGFNANGEIGLELSAEKYICCIYNIRSNSM